MNEQARVCALAPARSIKRHLMLDRPRAESTSEETKGIEATCDRPPACGVRPVGSGPPPPDAPDSSASVDEVMRYASFLWPRGRVLVPGRPHAATAPCDATCGRHDRSHTLGFRLVDTSLQRALPCLVRDASSQTSAPVPTRLAARSPQPLVAFLIRLLSVSGCQHACSGVTGPHSLPPA